MEARLASEMLATDLAEYLVRKVWVHYCFNTGCDVSQCRMTQGVPFRQTHHIAGDAVRMAEVIEHLAPRVASVFTVFGCANQDRGVELSSLTYEDLHRYSHHE